VATIAAPANSVACFILRLPEIYRTEDRRLPGYRACAGNFRKISAAAQSDKCDIAVFDRVAGGVGDEARYFRVIT
jgi:hypothetical protein